MVKRDDTARLSVAFASNPSIYEDNILCFGGGGGGVRVGPTRAQRKCVFHPTKTKCLTRTHVKRYRKSDLRVRFEIGTVNLRTNKARQSAAVFFQYLRNAI